MCERVTGAAARRRERRLRSWAKHERLSIAMALAEKLHHSVQKVVEQHAVPREQKTASASEGEEYRKNALYEAPRGQKTPLPGTRTVSTAPVPQVVLTDLGGEVVHDATLVAFLEVRNDFSSWGEMGYVRVCAVLFVCGLTVDTRSRVSLRSF